MLQQILSLSIQEQTAHATSVNVNNLETIALDGHTVGAVQT